jgi:hypothetical protein
MEPKMKQFWDDLLRARAGLAELMSEAFNHSDHALLEECLDLDDLLANVFRRTGDLFARHQTYEPQRVNEGGHRGHRKVATVVKRVTRAGPASVSNGLERGGYPKFHREQDRLVKIGCSGKNGKEYRHTCSIDDVIRLASRIAEVGSGGKPVKLRPVIDSLDEGLVNHQVYTAIDWLRTEGLLKHDGRGYVLESVGDLAGVVVARFQQLEERG